MLIYALRRLIYLVPVAFGVSLLVFALVHLAPGDPISAIVPPDAPKEVVDKLKEYYGFDKPLPVQYFRWLMVTLSGDFGTSIGTGRAVIDEVGSAFGNTIILAISATLLAFSLAIFLGTAAAYAKSRAVDRLVTLISLVGVSVPHFWLAIVLVIVFSVELGMLPPASWVFPVLTGFSADGTLRTRTTITPSKPVQRASKDVAMSSDSSFDPEFFQKLLESAFAVQESGVNARSLVCIVEIQRSIKAGHLDVDGTMRLIAEFAQQVAGASGVAVGRLKGDQLVYGAGSGSAASSVGRCVMATFIASAPNRTRAEILRVENAESDPRIEAAICRQFGATSLLILPIYHADAVAGVMQVLFGEAPDDVAALMSRLDRVVAANFPRNRFVTLFFGVLDPATGELTYCNAGHNPPFLVRADDSIERLTSCGTILGIFPDMSYEVKHSRLGPGDVLTLFSDGVTEENNPSGDEFGDDRLASLLVQFSKAHHGAEVFVEGIRQAVLVWAAGAAAADDVTVVVARRVP